MYVLTQKSLNGEFKRIFDRMNLLKLQETYQDGNIDFSVSLHTIP